MTRNEQNPNLASIERSCLVPSHCRHSYRSRARPQSSSQTEASTNTKALPENASSIHLSISLGLCGILFLSVSVRSLWQLRGDANSLRTSNLCTDWPVLARTTLGKGTQRFLILSFTKQFVIVYVRNIHHVLNMPVAADKWIVDPTKTLVPVSSQQCIVTDFSAGKETDSRSVPSNKPQFSATTVNLAISMKQPTYSLVFPNDTTNNDGLVARSTSGSCASHDGSRSPHRWRRS